MWWALTTLLREGAALSRPQDPAVLRALRHGAVEPRGGAGLRGRGGSERVRRARPRLVGGEVVTDADACRAARRGASSCGRRRRGRSSRTPRSPCIPELEYVELRKTDRRRTRTIILAEARARRRARRGLRGRAGTSGRHADRRSSSSARAIAGRSTGCRIREGTNHEIIVGEEFVSADDGTAWCTWRPRSARTTTPPAAARARVPAAGERARRVPEPTCRWSAGSS